MDHEPEPPSFFSGLPDVLFNAAYVPVELFLSISSRLLASTLSYSPHLVPALICSLLIPISLFVSAISGWYVWSSIPVGWQQPLYLQYGDGSSPYAHTPLPSLAPKQPYDISLLLTLPASESNFALGNFMSSLTLYSTANSTLTSIRRPAIAIPPRPRFFGGLPHTVDVIVPLLSDYIPGRSNINARVVLGREDGWKSVWNGESRELSVVTATLKGTVRHSGIRGLSTRFPLSFSVASFFVFFFILLLFATGCLLSITLRHLTAGESDVSQDEKGANLADKLGLTSDSDVDQKPAIRKRERRYSKPSRVIKAEETDTPPSSETVLLRRRRSRPVTDSDSDA